MKVLGIETTCDETAVAVVENGEIILSNVISSQSSFHEQYGGVYPEMAAREHVKAIIPTIQQALEEAKVNQSEIELIAVAQGPGLIGPLLIGLNAAKALALAWDKPFIGINHVEAHLFAAMMSNQVYTFPSLGVVVSGGHTFMIRMAAIGQYELIGTTVDDAVGEAFDKVASLLGLPYPGGPHIEQLAKTGNKKAYPFKAGKVKGHPWDFSFSGLKTSVLYAVKGQDGNKKGEAAISKEEKPHIAASFQEAALQDIAEKALAAGKGFDCKAIYVGGGVSHNQRLRELLDAELPVYWPGPNLSLDNAAMIAGLGYHHYCLRGADAFDLEPQTRTPELMLSLAKP